MKIYLMRHGKPDVSALPKRIKSTEFMACLEAYRGFPLLENEFPPEGLIDKLQDVRLVVCSDLLRSKQSAQRLLVNTPSVEDQLFREIEDDLFAIPYLKLKPNTWKRVFLLLWLLGRLDQKPNFLAAQQRAELCADVLIQYAKQHHCILFSGHGLINRYIAQALIKRGWQGSSMTKTSYWGVTDYSCK